MRNCIILSKRIFLLLSLLLPFWLQGQSAGFRVGPDLVYGDTAQQHQLVLNNYSRFVGTAVSLQNNQLRFHIKGAVDTTIFEVASLRFLGLTTGSSKVLDDEEKQLFAPMLADPTYLRTALPNKDKSRLRLVNLIYTVAEVNLGDNIQVGGGMLLPFGFLTTQRVGVKLFDEVYLGVSNQLVLPLFFNAFQGGFYVFGDAGLHLSVGNEQRFFSLGRGIFYATDFGLETVQNYSLSLGAQIGQNVHLYSELMLVNSEFGTPTYLPSLGLSVANRQHRWRFGVFNILEPSFTSVLVPLIGYDYRF